jgi:hypothetical protein
MITITRFNIDDGFKAICCNISSQPASGSLGRQTKAHLSISRLLQLVATFDHVFLEMLAFSGAVLQ